MSVAKDLKTLLNELSDEELENLDIRIGIPEYICPANRTYILNFVGKKVLYVMADGENIRTN